RNVMYVTGKDSSAAGPSEAGTAPRHPQAAINGDRRRSSTMSAPLDLSTLPLDPSRPRLSQPGLLPLAPGNERYWVRPGGVTALELSPGDELTVVDRFGAQHAEVTVLGRGRVDFEALGLRPDAPASVLSSLGEDAARTQDGTAVVLQAL